MGRSGEFYEGPISRQHKIRKPLELGEENWSEFLGNWSSADTNLQGRTHVVRKEKEGPLTSEKRLNFPAVISLPLYKNSLFKYSS